MKQIITTDLEELRRVCGETEVPASKSMTKFIDLIQMNGYRRTVNKSLNSYALKHLVERLAKACGHYEYISNEHLIVALVNAGFIAKNVAREGCFPGPNYYFNLSTEGLNNVFAECEKLEKIQTGR